MRLFICLSLILVLLTSVGSFAQHGPSQKTPPAEPEKQTSESTAQPLTIKLNVMVLDSKKQPVTNLSADQFTVFEDDVQQKVTSIQKKSGPVKFDLLIDRSGSMRSVLSGVVGAAQGFVDFMEPDDQCQIIPFVSSDNITLGQGFTSDKLLLRRVINNLYVEGGASAVVDALYITTKTASEGEKNPSARRAIVVISDGEDSKSFYKRDQLLKVIEDLQVPIFFLQIGGKDDLRQAEKAKKLVDTIALFSGGAAYSIDNKTEYPQVIAYIALELRAQYVVTYTSTNPSLNGKSRKLRVEVSGASGDEKLSAMTRTTFTVPKKF